MNRSINSPEPSTGFYVRSREHVVSGDRWDGVLLFLKKDISFLRPVLEIECWLDLISMKTFAKVIDRLFEGRLKYFNRGMVGLKLNFNRK